MNRRRFLLLAGGGLATVGAGYAYTRGLRYPPLHLAGTGPVTRGSADGTEVSAQGAVFQGAQQNRLRFRAYVPEPEFTVRGGNGGGVQLVVENLHPGAALHVEPGSASPRSVSEEGALLTRVVTVKDTAPARFGWRFPRGGQYRFAAVGDSGGGTELQWVLRRAEELGADFLIHLGDIHYEEGDFDRAAKHLNAAGIPTYAAIGNHDFSDSGEVLYPRFHEVVGPANSVFRLGGIEFVNVDTGAGFAPAARGVRARILNGLAAVGSSPDVRERVAFTHMPLRDPDPERSHAISRTAEADWLRERLLAAGTRNLLAGHIHIKREFDDHGLHTYITGQGLGHADLIGPGTYRSYAEILLGDVAPGEAVRYRWQPLAMPLEAHCSARNLGVLEAMGRTEVRASLMKQCGKG